MLFHQTLIGAIAALPTLASAHYFFPTLIVNGQTSDMWEYVRESSQGYEPQYTPDILTSDDLRCNTNSLSAANSTSVASVKAGDSVAFVPDYGARIQHPGPMTFWMSQAPSGNVTEYDGSGDWFKIAVIGYNTPFTSAGTNWRTYNDSKLEVKIPTTVPNGQYLLRIEHIGVHRPSTREMYFNCAQIEVTGSSATSLPTDTNTIPGIYNASDEWVTWSMYSTPAPSSFPYAGPSTIDGGVFDSEGSDSGASGSGASDSEASDSEDSESLAC